MSFLTATNTELIYDMEATGPDVGSSTSATIISAGTAQGSNPPAYIPPLYSIWQPSTVVGKGFRVVIAGTFDVSSGTNGITFQYGLNTTAGTAPPALILAKTGSINWANVTAGGWYAQFDVVIISAGQSSGQVVSAQVNGFISQGAANNAATAAATAYQLGGTTSSGSAAATVTTWSPVSAYYWEATATIAAAGTHFQCTQHQVFGLN